LLFCNVCRLDTGYVDLYLIHSPHGGDIVRTYDAVLELKAKGLIRFVLQILVFFHFSSLWWLRLNLISYTVFYGTGMFQIMYFLMLHWLR